MFEMHERAFDVIDLERAADATLLPARTEHEMLDDKLAAPVEQISERFLTLRAVEEIGLVDLDPGKFRSALNWSRKRVSSFSFARCALRAASHSSRVTIRLCIILRSPDFYRSPAKYS